ncbi:hypothetical protein FSC37_23065 [Piscinibacter aquaticus]|uniref:Uncharacterized protein n=1 Tax=Piscinibacter aquaticus TaxID=392597 RepID=A0A5C6TPB1_9BURK|nr:hypothetical protein FSC37_23065 [Piscinibacter aquaticus]
MHGTGQSTRAVRAHSAKALQAGAREGIVRSASATTPIAAMTHWLAALDRRLARLFSILEKGTLEARRIREPRP